MVVEKYIGYCRVSTQKQGLGLLAQRQILKHYLGDNLVSTISEKKSAKDMDRSVLLKVINKCKEKGWGIAIAKVDRLSRKTEDAIWLWKEMEAKLYSCDIPMPVGGKMDKFLLIQQAAFAERELEIIRLRTIQGMAQSTKPLFPLCKYLWTKQRPKMLEAAKKGRDVQHERAKRDERNVRAAVVIKQMLKDGCNMSQIARELNENGFRTTADRPFQVRQISKLIRMYGYAPHQQIDFSKKC